MKTSIFHGLPATGPLMQRPTMAAEVEKKKDTNPSPAPVPRAPSVGFGFGAPKPVVRITVPGENYSDYVTPTETPTPAAAAPGPASPQAAPASYVDESAESYSEEGALNLKRGSAYYDDDAPVQTATVHISPAASFGAPKHLNPSLSSSAAYSNDTYTNDASSSYQDDSAGAQMVLPTPPPGAYSDDSASGYTDETTSSVPSRSVGYTDDEAPPASVSSPSAGYSDDTLSSPPQGAYSGGYTDESSGSTAAGYSDETPPPRPHVATVTLSPPAGYSDDDHSASNHQANNYVGAYSDDAAVAPPKPSAPTLVPGAGAYAGGGYSDDSGSTSVGYNDGYTDEQSTGKTATTDPFAAATASTAYGYSDDSSITSAGDKTSLPGYGYDDASPQLDPFSSAPQDSATYGDGAGYSDAGAAYTQKVGYAQDVGYAEPDAGAGYSDAASTTYGSQPTSVSTPTSKPQLDKDGSRDWNTDFQKRMSRFRQVVSSPMPAHTDVLLSCRDLYSLSEEFIAIAQEIGRTIIEEVSIPAPAKSIKPVNVGGVAGGEKYVERGIFFKFAIDAFGVYGGDEFAQKAAGHELAGLKAYYNCKIEGLNTPFMLLMDYRGYRLIATTKLPIGGGSLIYGSADGGITVHKDNPTMNEMMQKAAAILNIKPHVVGMRNQTDILYAPTDIEGHIGSDGRYYVLDTARICPPEPIHKSFTAVILPPEEPIPPTLSKFRLWHNRNDSRERRPQTGEFWSPWPALKEVGLTTERWMDQIYAHLGVANSGTNIVSSEEFGEGLLYHLKDDIIATTQLNTRNRMVNVRASNLVKQVIHGPALLVLRGRKGAQLFNLLRYETVKQSPVPLSSDAFTPFGKHSRDIHNDEVENAFYHILSDIIPKFLKESQLFPHAAGALKAMQHAGINTRMIGFLRSSILDTHQNAVALRAWILNEMIVRVTKNYLRSKLRSATSKLEPIEPIIIERVNLLLGSSTSSNHFWATEMKAQIVNKFGRNGQALTPHELKVEVDLRTSLNKLALFQLLQSKIGVIFTEEANGRFQIDSSRFEVPAPLSVKDLSKLVVLQKSLLQPDLDQLILRTAASASSTPEQLLEISGAYLPGADSHPALALQRLLIADRLVQNLLVSLGWRYDQNFMYTSNLVPVVHMSESDAEYRKACRPQLHPKADAAATELYQALDNFLDSSKDYQELLSHLEVLRIWVESTPYCPLEISCKLFYLRGCLAMIHRSWSTAEAFLRTAYDCITRVTSVPNAFHKTYKTGYVAIDNDRPFSLMILDKLVHVMIALDRHQEALSYSEKWILQLSESSFPGKMEDLQDLFGPFVPISFGVYRTYTGRNHIRETLNVLEQKFLKVTTVDAVQLKAWNERVSLSNFGELSGFSLSPGVLQQYIDAGAFRQSPSFPHIAMEGAYWAPQNSTRTFESKLDQVISIPPVLIAGVHDVLATFIVHPNRLEYSKGPHRMLMLANTDYSHFTSRPGYKYIIPTETIFASINMGKIKKNPRGTVCFSQVDLKPGFYTCVIVDGANDVVGGVTSLASQVMHVFAPTASSKFVFAHDNSANWWRPMLSLPSTEANQFAICDSDYDNYDGKNSATSVYMLDAHGKVWKTTSHNYTQAPPCLLRNSEETVGAPVWNIINDLFAWKVTSIAVSTSHTLILTDNGEVLSLGSNAHGALGHGDTVAQSDPRLVRKLKGKPINQILAGEDRSIAIDEFGGIYQWGKSFTALPDLHPFFSGKSKASRGVKIPIAKAFFQGFLPPTRNYRPDPNEFFKHQPIAYLSTEGQAFLWCANESLFPVSEEYKPEQVLMPKDPIVDMAISANAIAFVTVKGEVWTGGGNSEGELGCGFGSIIRAMPRSSFKSDVPYSNAERIASLAPHFITRIISSMFTFFALSDQAEFFKWGGSCTWSPAIPTAVRGLKVSNFTAGLRGLLIHVDQEQTLPLPHHPLCSAHMEALATTPQGDASEPASSTGSTFSIEYRDVDPQPDFVLHVTVPKTQLGSDYHIRIVKPGQTSTTSAALWLELGLPSLDDSYEVDVEGFFSKGQWGPAPHYIDRNPPLVAGDYQALIIRKITEDNIEIRYRSPTFTIKPYLVKHTLTMNPALPKPREMTLFNVLPVPLGATHQQWIVLRNKADNQLMGCVQVDGPAMKWEPYMAGHYIASWEYTADLQGPPISTFASIEFEVGEPMECRPQIELEIVPSGPYYCGQAAVLEWKYVKNPPQPGVQFFGGLYLAEAKGMGAVMQGGYTNLADASGTASITLPSQKAEYEFRAWHVVPSAGMVKIGSILLPVTLDTAPAQAAPSSSPDATSSDLSAASGSSNQSMLVSYSPSRSAYPDWEAFFNDCQGMDSGTAKAYAKLLSTSLPVSKAHLLDGGILAMLKITSVPHLLLIMEQIHALRQAQLKDFLEQQFQQFSTDRKSVV